MMRRIVDATIPTFVLVGVVPVFVQLVNLPMSLRDSIGKGLGILWCVAVGLAMAAIVVGIIIRPNADRSNGDAVHRASLAFRFEYPALFVAGFISAIYGVALFGVSGWRGWTAAWFVWAIGAHCLARYAELSLARRRVKVAGG